MIEAAIQGCGLAYVWQHRAHPHLASGALIRCLDDWWAAYDSLYLYYLSRGHLFAGMRALIDMLKTTW